MPLRTSALVFLLAGALLPSPPMDSPQGAAINPVSRIQPPPVTYVFPEGQTLVYDVEWRLWTAGTATLSMSSAGDERHVTGSADSTGVAAVLYKVHDRFQSTFDRRTFCSQSLRKHTEEGFRARDTLISFNYDLRKSLLDETNLKSGERKHQENAIPGCVTDVLSGIFYVASLPLVQGVTYTFPLNDGGKTVNVQAQAEAREVVKTPAGEFQTIRVSPTAASGVVKERGRIWIWYSNDTRRIPVQMRARMFWGTLTFRLTRIERK
jgi:hypothetical protein